MASPEVENVIRDRPVVTREMVEAGYEVICGYEAESGDPWDSAISVYLAMESARRRPSRVSSSPDSVLSPAELAIEARADQLLRA